MSTKIDWCINPDGTPGETLNVTTGCTKISAGCKNCYACVMTRRLKAMGIEKYKYGFDKVVCHPRELEKPYRWKKPRTIFVNSMSDLFHEDVTTEFILDVFKMMNDLPRHTFILLTKRPERLLELNKNLNWTPNIWMGVTVEDYRYIDRIKLLEYNITAKVKFISFEPLIQFVGRNTKLGERVFGQSNINGNKSMIDWIIVGGETGHGAREMGYTWVNDLFCKAKEFHTPFFFKGWGTATMKKTHPDYYKFKGQEWREMPRREK